MTRKSIDDLAARLFECAHEEVPPHGAEQRLLQALQQGVGGRASLKQSRARQRPRWVGLGLAAIVLAGVVLFPRQATPPPHITAEKLTGAVEPSASAAAERSEPRPNPDEHAKPVGSAAPGPPKNAKTTKASPPTLAQELAALQRARRALDSGDAEQTLRVLAEYDRVLRGQALSDEASLLRIEALSRSGRADAASEQARRFVAEHPNSPLVDRARSFIAAVGRDDDGQ